MPAQPTFLPLSETELADLFGDDTDGMRRYHLLHAVLAQGMTQREAAAAANVSERTVRNILRAYTHSGGLEALRSRQTTTRRRDRRPAAFEQALSEALAGEPNAGGDRLWRHAQELLGEDGKKLSRRTAYRILANLRSEHDEDDDAPDSLRGIVKAALPLIAEEPPLTLGSSALAQRFLPADLGQQQRGLLLQQALRSAMDRLRPDGAVSTIDRSWWPYLICTGEYEASQSRTELQDDLALSPSTYSRAKRQGIDRIAAAVPQMLEHIVEAPAALPSQQIPRAPHFVGRHDEQSYYAWRLQTEGLAHIWGIPGSGKTALAAELAAEGKRYGQTILWHTCRPGRDSTLLGIIRGLAQAFAGAGDDRLWREMRQTALDEQDPDALLDTLRNMLLARPAVGVLDNVHHADSEETDALLDALADLVVRRSSRLLLVGRDPVAGVDYPPLHGLSEREAEILWTGTPALPFDQWRALFATTGGMPEPIRRAAAAVRRNSETARAEGWMEAANTWSTDAVWNRLDANARKLMTCAYALREVLWSDHAELVCETIGVEEDDYADLVRRGLLRIDQGHLNLFGALHTLAAAHLRGDEELREQTAALAADLSNLPTSQTDGIVERSVNESPASRSAHSSAPSGMELIERMRNALGNSAAYLRTQGGETADQLARELAALQDALPHLREPRSPFDQATGRTAAI